MPFLIMKIAVLIITYTSARHTERMIRCLDNGDFDFYIHLDKKVDIQTHSNLFNKKNIHFVEDRKDIKWAGYSTTEAILNGIRRIKASGIRYDFVNLISGQDYPIKSAAYISAFLQQNIGKEFIRYSDFDEWKEGWKRVRKYYFTDFRFKGQYIAQGIINFFAPKRKFPLYKKLYGREMFWMLSLDCALYVANVIDSNPELSRFLKYTWAAEEFIFQTIILNSPYKDKVVNDHYRYIVWPAGAASPRILLTADFDDMMASEALFGRKFNIDIDENILDLLDKANGCKA